jgi:DNA-binding Xre family transcriptional regulator
MLMYRIRIDALMRDKGLENGYQLARDAKIPETTAYRLLKSQGRVTSFDSTLVKKLCEFWGRKPMDLIEWVDEPSPKRVRKSRKAK